MKKILKLNLGALYWGKNCISKELCPFNTGLFDIFGRKNGLKHLLAAAFPKIFSDIRIIFDILSSGIEMHIESESGSLEKQGKIICDVFG